MTEKISVIVPVYKVEAYLRKCLDSIVAQTYKNLEIILVDDGSPDSCGAICDEYAARDERIIVIHQQNSGVSAARNAALDIATGDYIGFVDSDDWIEPDMYEYLHALAQDHEGEVIQCGLYLDNADKSTTMFVLPSPEDCLCFTEMTEKSWQLLCNGSCNKLYRNAAVKGQRFDPAYTWGEDLLYNLECISRKCKLCIGAMPKYHYLQRDGSACHPGDSWKNFSEIERCFNRASELFADIPFHRDHIVSSHVLSMLDSCSQLVRYGYSDSSEQKNLLRSAIRGKMGFILSCSSLPIKEKAKSLLVSYAWWLYRPLLLTSKKIFHPLKEENHD